MLRRLLVVLLLTLAFSDCGARHHAQTVIASYKTAVQQNDIPTFVRLAEPNTRTLIEREWFTKQDTLDAIDELVAHPSRVIATSQGVAYIGWFSRHGERRLMQLVIGEGRVISAYSELQNSSPNPTSDWQVAMIPTIDWSITSVRTTAQQTQVEQALATIPDELFVTWYFQGSSDARTAIKKQLPRF